MIVSHLNTNCIGVACVVVWTVDRIKNDRRKDSAPRVILFQFVIVYLERK